MLKPETTTIIDGPRQDLGVTYYHKNDGKDLYPYLHNHEFYEMTYIKTGKAIHFVNNSRDVLQPGTMLFIRPDDVHRFMGLNDKTFELVTICVSYELMEEIMRFMNMEVAYLHRSPNPLKRIFPNSQGRYITSILEQMMSVIDNEADPNEVKRCVCVHMAHFIYSIVTMDNSGRKMPDWLKRTVEEMEKEENFSLGYDKMLEISGVSPAHLSREMKVFFDMTPSEYVGVKRVGLAKAMFDGGETNMNIIYQRCGFGSLSNFYLVFKKQTGLNPGEYMRAIQA